MFYTNGTTPLLIVQDGEHTFAEIPCVDSRPSRGYLNQATVKSALHARADRTWDICTRLSYRRSYTTMVPIYQELIRNGLRGLHFTGTWDGAVLSM